MFNYFLIFISCNVFYLICARERGGDIVTFSNFLTKSYLYKLHLTIGFFLILWLPWKHVQFFFSKSRHCSNDILRIVHLFFHVLLSFLLLLYFKPSTTPFLFILFSSSLLIVHTFFKLCNLPQLQVIQRLCAVHVPEEKNCRRWRKKIEDK